MFGGVVLCCMRDTCCVVLRCIRLRSFLVCCLVVCCIVMRCGGMSCVVSCCVVV